MAWSSNKPQCLTRVNSRMSLISNNLLQSRDSDTEQRKQHGIIRIKTLAWWEDLKGSQLLSIICHLRQAVRLERMWIATWFNKTTDCRVTHKLPTTMAAMWLKRQLKTRRRKFYRASSTLIRKMSKILSWLRASVIRPCSFNSNPRKPLIRLPHLLKNHSCRHHSHLWIIPAVLM